MATKGRGKIYKSITETVGDTPIVRLDKLAKKNRVKANLLAKLEFFNPTSSVKDRIGVAMESTMFLVSVLPSVVVFCRLAVLLADTQIVIFFFQDCKFTFY